MSYKTVKKDAFAEIEIKKSKFIAHIAEIKSEDEAETFIKQTRKKYYDATHNCSAYILNSDRGIRHSSDDGEPSGSAGLPIYNQLLANDITNVLLIIVRYFGGTKLGVSGLVKAYKESAKATIEEAKIITKELESEIEIIFKFSQQNIIFSLLNKFNAQVLEFNSHEQCLIRASVKTAQKENISEILSEMHLISFKFI